MSLIRKFLEKKVFINDCSNARSVTKRQVNKALALIKQGRYSELIAWYKSTPRVRNKKYNKYKYRPIQELVKNKQGCTYRPIDPDFYSDFESQLTYSDADYVFIDKLLHMLNNTTEVDAELRKACNLLAPDGVIIVKEWTSTHSAMEVVDFFNLTVLSDTMTLEDFQESGGMYLAFAEWKRLFEELGYTVVESMFQEDMYNSFYFVLKPAAKVQQLDVDK